MSNDRPAPFEPATIEELKAENTRYLTTCVRNRAYIDKLQTEATILGMQNVKLHAENKQLRRTCRAKKAFELAIVCLMRRLPRDDACSILAAKLIDRYGYAASSKRRRAALAHGTKGSGAGANPRPADPYDLDNTEP